MIIMVIKMNMTNDDDCGDYDDYNYLGRGLVDQASDPSEALRLVLHRTATLCMRILKMVAMMMMTKMIIMMMMTMMTMMMMKMKMIVMMMTMTCARRCTSGLKVGDTVA